MKAPTTGVGSGRVDRSGLAPVVINLRPFLVTRTEAAALCRVPLAKWDRYVLDNELVDARVYRGRRCFFVARLLEKHCETLPRVRLTPISLDGINEARRTKARGATPGATGGA